MATNLSYGDTPLEIAADGDRVAVAFSWERDEERDHLYVSEDAGRNWTLTPAQAHGNGAHLYVLADGRLVLMWSEDLLPTQVLVSTGSDWAELEEVDIDFPDPGEVGGSKRFSVNRAGIALIPSFTDPIDPCAVSCTGGAVQETPVLDTVDFSTDLTNWRTIESLELINQVP